MSTEALLGMQKSPNAVRDAVEHTVQWHVTISSEGYGMAHKIALKRNFRDTLYGINCLLIVHFAVPISKGDLRAF